jgi:hypothetical protein
MSNVARDKRLRGAYSKAARLAERANVARAAALEAAADADRLAENIVRVDAQRAALGRSRPSRAISRPAVSNVIDLSEKARPPARPRALPHVSAVTWLRRFASSLSHERSS